MKNKTEEVEYGSKIKNLLEELNMACSQLDSYRQAKFALEQVSAWNQRFMDAKRKIPSYKIVDAVAMAERIGCEPVDGE